MNTRELESILDKLCDKRQTSYEEDLFIDVLNALLQNNEIDTLENQDLGKTESSD